MDPRDELRKPTFGLGCVLGGPPLVARGPVSLGHDPVCAPHRRQFGSERLREGAVGGIDSANRVAAAECRLRQHERAVHDAVAPPACSTRDDDRRHEFLGELGIAESKPQARHADVGVVPGDPGPRRPNSDPVEDGRGAPSERDRSSAIAQPLRGPSPDSETADEMEVCRRSIGGLGALLQQPCRLAERVELNQRRAEPRRRPRGPLAVSKLAGEIERAAADLEGVVVVAAASVARGRGSRGTSARYRCRRSVG